MSVETDDTKASGDKLLFSRDKNFNLCFVLLQQEVCEDAALPPSLCLLLDQFRSNLLYLHREPPSRQRCQVAPDGVEDVWVSFLASYPRRI